VGHVAENFPGLAISSRDHRHEQCNVCKAAVVFTVQHCAPKVLQPARFAVATNSFTVHWLCADHYRSISGRPGSLARGEQHKFPCLQAKVGMHMTASKFLVLEASIEMHSMKPRERSSAEHG
jgi:hypothetical protein